MACLSENTVAAFVEGLLTTDAAARLEAHAASCPACRRLLSEIAKGRSPGPQTSLCKLLASNLRQDVDLLAVGLDAHRNLLRVVLQERQHRPGWGPMP